MSVSTLPLHEAHDGSVRVRGNHGGLNKLVLKKATFVGAIVMYEEPTESTRQYAPSSSR